MSKVVAKPPILAEASQLVEQLQAQGVAIPSREAITTFLTAHPDLLALLTPIVETAREHLPDAELSLERYTDPEIDDEYLVIYARFPEYDEGVLQRIDRAREACEPLWQGAPDLVFITTDFKPSHGV
ncbi:MAG: hypothetical protein N2554_06475 [Fimbriimonadales bacterium]|nr:hypothetical protein [Fimbriimonadales bacterium]